MHTLGGLGAAQAGEVLPQGGHFTAGQGTIATANGGTVINQSTTHGIIDWQGFSIGAGNSVQFNNGSGATLNRVTGGALSTIDGRLSASGSVYLINRQGVVVGPGGKVVTTGSFVASTRDVDSRAFMNGGALNARGSSSGTVDNRGSISSGNGDVILFGRSVSNSGNISAPGGTAGMAAGNTLLLRPANGDPRIVVSGGRGSVTQSGTVQAAQAELAAAGGNVYALAGNNGGAISATGTTVRGGHVWLTAGGGASVTGAVSARNADGGGGTVVVTGGTVDVGATARISASGTQGGTILIGGDQAGGDPAKRHVAAPVRNAKTTTVAAGARLTADAGDAAGDGGTVIVWADQNTIFGGAISVQGGRLGGDGGFVETSGRQGLSVQDGAFVNALAPRGNAGDWLLDPKNIVIQTGGSTTAITGTFGYGTDATGTDTIAPSAITGANANVTLQASNDITVASPVTMTNSIVLSLNAGRSIVVNANIASKGGFTATINDAGATAANRDPGKAAFTMAAGTTISTAATGSATAGKNISITTGTLASDSSGATSLPANIGDITLASLNASGQAGSAVGAGGTITVTNSQGNILSQGTGGVTITSNGATASSGSSIAGGAGGAIQLTATNGGIGSDTTALGAISATGGNGRSTNGAGGSGGAVTLNGGGGVWAGTLTTTAGTKSGSGSAGTVGAISVQSANGSVALTTSTTGTLTASAVNGSVVLTVGALTTGTMTLTANTASGTVTIQPLNAAATMGINNAGGSTLNLTTANLGRITAKSFVFGSGTASGDMTIGGTVTAPATITNLTLETGGALALDFSATFNDTKAGAVVTFASDTLTLSGTVKVNGSGSSLVLDTASDATTDGTYTLAALSLKGGAAYDVEGADNVGALSIDTTNNVVFQTANNLTIGTGGITSSGVVDVSVWKNITVGGPIAATNGKAITLTADANQTGSSGKITWTGSLAFSGSGTITTYGNLYAGTRPSYAGIGSFTPYSTIYSLTGLSNMKNDLTGSYILMNDVDASGSSVTPAGSAATPFTGTFNGQGFTISDLTIADTAGGETGLFGALGAGAMVENLTLTRGTIAGTGTVGAVAGVNQGGSVTNVSSTASVSSSGGVAGGLVGVNRGSISGSFAAGTVTAPSGTAGGLAGVNDAGGSVSHSFSLGAVSGQTAGGLLGQATGGSVAQSFATGSATGGTAGGLIGAFDSGTVDQSYASGAADGTVAAGGMYGTGGGTTTASYYDATINVSHDASSAGPVAGVTGLTSEQFGTASSFAGWSFGTTAGSGGWVIVDTDSTLNNAGGAAGATRPMLLSLAATPGNPTFISNGFQLQLAVLDLAASYDIVGTVDFAGLGLADPSGLWFGKGFVPLGSATLVSGADPANPVLGAVHPFSGTLSSFFGGAVANLYINRPDQDFVGLVGYSTGTVKNVSIAGAIIGRDFTGGFVGGQSSTGDVEGLGSTATVTGRDFTGGVVGFNAGGAIGTQCCFAALSGATSGRDYVGGVVGYDMAPASGAITRGFFPSGDVSGRDYVGGVVGRGNATLIGSASGNVSGRDHVGGLIGWDDGAISGSYSLGDVSGANQVGGFVGTLGDGATITQSFTTGSVSGTDDVGGFVGSNHNLTTVGPDITQSFALGIAGGRDNVGGFVGDNLAGIQDSYTMDAAAGDANVGGFVGHNAASGTITNAWSIGYVSGTANAGGFAGSNDGAVANGWFNSTTSGLSDGFGTSSGSADIRGGTTGELAAQPTGAGGYGFDTTVWADGRYPVLSWFYPSGADYHTGTVLSGIDAGGTPPALVKGVAVKADLGSVGGNGPTAGMAGSTGADGTYTILIPKGAGAYALFYTSSGAMVTTNLTGDDYPIYQSALNLVETNNTTGSLQTLDLFAPAAGQFDPKGVAIAQSRPNLALTLADAAQLRIDRPVNASVFAIISNGTAITQSASITAGTLVMNVSNGGTSVLSGASNAIGQVQGALGTLDLRSTVALTVGAATADGPVTLRTAGDLTLAGAVTVTANDADIVLAADGHFSNTVASGQAITLASGGRWLVYSHDPAGDSFGTTLDSGNNAVWNATYGTAPPGIVASGNRYVFAYQPTVVLTSVDASKIYGEDDSAALPSSYTVSGIDPGVAHAYLADTAAMAFSGTPELSSAGSASTATVAGGPYAINVGVGTVTVSDGYAVSFASSGRLTITPKALTVTANDATKTYGDTVTFAGIEFTVGSGLINGDAIDSVTLTSGGAAATAQVASSPYAITASGASGTGASNYDITYVEGSLTVDPKALTITVRDARKTYGDTLVFSGKAFDADGLVNGDTVTAINMTSAGAAATANVAAAPYAVAANGAHGTGLGNYAISYVSGALTIDPRALTIALPDLHKAFGGTLVFNGKTFGVSGLVNGDTVTGVNMTSVGIGASADDGVYAILGSGVHGTGLGNYAIAYASGTLTVDPAPAR